MYCKLFSNKEGYLSTIAMATFVIAGVIVVFVSSPAINAQKNINEYIAHSNERYTEIAALERTRAIFATDIHTSIEDDKIYFQDLAQEIPITEISYEQETEIVIEPTKITRGKEVQFQIENYADITIYGNTWPAPEADIGLYYICPETGEEKNIGEYTIEDEATIQIPRESEYFFNTTYIVRSLHRPVEITISCTGPVRRDIFLNQKIPRRLIVESNYPLHNTTWKHPHGR